MWFDWLLQKSYAKPDGYIYLRCEPNVCLNRIQNRDREEETNIPVDYLTSLHNKHDNWLLNTKILTLILNYVSISGLT